ncbi:hypothetical protein [Desulfolucanica intricata]|uniref:hypothetical protein n=1 Tax=Desulfolucanica intricata TaxID=1285191 RepID=UPI000835FE61|nr:hypothetical protein [Desulfolucanica intricata]
MAQLPPEFNFATGVTVNIVTTRLNFTGELIDVVENFLVVRLTAATAPFAAGQVIRINVDEIIAIG